MRWGAHSRSGTDCYASRGCPSGANADAASPSVAADRSYQYASVHRHAGADTYSDGASDGHACSDTYSDGASDRYTSADTYSDGASDFHA